MKRRSAISLFCSAGIGDLGICANGIHTVVANELLADRCDLFRHNHPDTFLFEGDIWEHAIEIIAETRRQLRGSELFMAYATPPCQGMSTNGQGKLKSEVDAGNRPAEDPRNRLIIPAMDVICALNPRWIILENVPGMQETEIRTDLGQERILDFIARRLGDEYVGRGEVLACADYGIPQLRRRLISVFTRDERGREYFERNCGSFFPKHERSSPHLTLRDAIANLPTLDARDGKNSRTDYHPMHWVSTMSDEKYWWIANTPEGQTAYNNQCVNPTCNFKATPGHQEMLIEGRWKASKTIPVYCSKCGSLLPRPTMVDKKSGELRAISGFHSSYRRMEWDKPARALTSNFPFEASDNKVHPAQNRTLSIYEAMVIQTISDYPYEWESAGQVAGRSLIAHVIGESVPPRLVDFIVRKVVNISIGSVASRETATLFDR